MKKLLGHVQQRLKTRKMYHQTIAQVISTILKAHAVDPTHLKVQLKTTVCTVLLSEKEDKTKRFLQKPLLLTQINEKLHQDGWEVTVKELKIG